MMDIDSDKVSSLDEESLLSRAMNDSRRAIRSAATWKEEAKEDFSFAVGNQWEKEDKEALENSGRPALVINKIAVQLDVISGHERNNSARLKVSPEGMEDNIFSEICDKAIAYIDKMGKLSFKQHQQFDDGNICGKGVMELVIDYTIDPLHGELAFRLLSPFSVFHDPECQEYDLSDAEFCVKVEKVSRARLKTIYPKKEAVINELGAGSGEEWIEETRMTEGDKDNYGLRSSSNTVVSTTEIQASAQKITLVEYWYKKYVPKWFAFDIDKNRVVKYDSEEEANSRLSELKDLYGKPDPMTGQPLYQEAVKAIEGIKPVKRDVAEMWVLAFVGKTVLEHGKSPLEPKYNGFPFFFFRSYWRPSADTEAEKLQGLVRRMKDPQREVNKARSQYLHILNTGANSGIIADEDAMADEKFKEAESFGSTPGYFFRVKPGARFDRIDPVAPSYAQQLREKTATENLKEVTGINADLLAFEDKTVSGRAIAMRVKQALTIVAGVFENWKMTKRLLGEAIFKLIPEIMDSSKLSKIIGQSFMATNGLSEGSLGAILTQIEDGRYDVAIAEATDSPTLKQETFEQLLEIAERSKMALPPSVLLKFSNIPNVSEVVKSIDEYQQKLQAQQGQGGAPVPPSPQPTPVNAS